MLGLRLKPLLLVAFFGLGSCTGPTDGPAPLALPLSDRIVFASDALDALGDVFVMKIDGTDARRLTGGDTRDFCPALSPDGNWIAFLQAPASQQNPAGDPPSMVLMKANGTKKSVLGQFQTGSYDCPVWSRDSRLVAFASPVEPMVRNSNQPIVRTYDTNGNLIAQFTAAQLNGYSFSPDDHRLLYSSHGFSIGPPIDFHLETVNLDGTDRRRVTGGYSGDWSPDGAEIIFDTCGGQCSSSDMSTTCPGICTVSPDGTSQHVLTPSGRNPVFSPSGDRVAYSCGNDLCVIPAGGGEVTTVLGTGQFIGPVWSPDGQRIGFACIVGIQRDICLADLQTKTVTNLTQSAANEDRFSFSPRSSP